MLFSIFTKMHIFKTLNFGSGWNLLVPKYINWEAMQKIKCMKIIHAKFRGAQKLMILRYLFPRDTCFCFYMETNFLTKCQSHYP